MRACGRGTRPATTAAEDDRFYERMSLLQDLDEKLDGLYREFLEVRTGPAWTMVRGHVAAWAREGA